MKLRISDFDFRLTDCSTRLPFRFGIVTMTHAPLCTAHVRVETEDGRISDGFAADLLAPKWFEKDPAKTIEEDWRALLGSARECARSARGEEGSVFELWWSLYGRRVGGVAAGAPDRLVRGFGVALCERALMDAACRAAGVSFFQALKQDLFGFRPGAVLPELAGWDLAASLPASPAATVQVRHTVGLLDPLRDDDIAPDERLSDGLPQSLEENVRHYGLRVFKIKIQGDPERDLARLLALADILEQAAEGEAVFTLDGNEQFENVGQLVELFERVKEHEAGRRLLARLLYIEQPLSRTVTFDRRRNAGVDHLAGVLEEAGAPYAGLIIDEADSGIDSFERATELGYRGISVKNCKGVFRALLNRGLCESLSMRDGSRGKFFQSAEDLTNLPILALQQDLTTVAALGFEHVERNGHHYFHGLDHLPRDEVRQALERHRGLYRSAGASAFLDIRGGELDLGSLNCAGYGHDVDVDMDARRPWESWLASLAPAGDAP